MAENDKAATAVADAAKKKIAEEREQRAKAIAESDKRQGTPTPTQEENDLAALGVPMPSHADDGSGPDPRVTNPHGGAQAKSLEADKPASGSASYQTRSAHSTHHRTTSE